MKNIKILSLLVCLVAVLVGCSKEDDHVPVSVTARTVLMYLVADNSICGDIYSNIASVEQGLSQAKSPGTFVIYWDGGSRKSEFPEPTLFRYVVDGKGNVSEREIIRTYNAQNSLSNEVFNSILKDVERYCPADNYGLIFGSHATGWLPVDHSKSRSFGDDDGIKIDIPELAEVLGNSNIRFDYILFDACLMSQVEVAYELRNIADYLILSPAEVMSTGFPYFNIVKYLLATDKVEQNVTDVAKDFVDYYENGDVYHWGTIAVVKTEEIPALSAIVQSIMNQYQDNLSKFDHGKIDYFQNRYGFGRSYLSNSSYDLRAFIRELTDGNIPTEFEEQLSRTVIYSDYVNTNPLVNIDPEVYSGIGCYIPDSRFTKWNDYFKNLQWYSAVGWNEIGW